MMPQTAFSQESMMTTPYETEMKFYAPDLAAIQQRLEAGGAVCTAPRVFERNVRYENATHSMSEKGLVLRLRQDTRVRLTYKEPSEGKGDMSHRPEWEVEVSDFETMEVILSKLGYDSYMVYEKYRTTYTWNDTEIVLDELPYGSFVEIEGEEEGIRAATKTFELEGLTPQADSYVKLFERVQRMMGLKFYNLTFKNFEGIVVPSRIFSATPNEGGKA
jgi:adenylate cyclase class 2